MTPPGSACREAWPFILGVYKLDSTAAERAAQAQQLRSEYTALRATWRERADAAGAEGARWRELESQIAKDVARYAASSCTNVHSSCVASHRL
jgi:hypothetical protein